MNMLLVWSAALEPLGWGGGGAFLFWGLRMKGDEVQIITIIWRIKLTILEISINILWFCLSSFNEVILEELDKKYTLININYENNAVIYAVFEYKIYH